MDRLERFLDMFGWRGGTVHQVNTRLKLITGKPIDINELSEEEYKRLYRTLDMYLNARMNRYGL